MKRVALVVMMAACGDGAQPPPDALVDRAVVLQGPATPNRSLDVLVVVDDSNSTAHLQEDLAKAFPSFIDVLSSGPGGFPDLHLGVVTSDLGTLGSSSPTPGPDVGVPGQGGCSGRGRGGTLSANNAPVTGSFVSDIGQSDGTRLTNYTGELADAFRGMVRVGSTGCGFEQPLAAMHAALAGNPANAGFLRPDAVLAVIFIQDEDDCSVKDASQLFAPEGPQLGPLQSFRCTRFGVLCGEGGLTPDAMNQVGVKSQCHSNESSALLDGVESYREFLLGLKANPSQVLVGGIFGDPTQVAVELRLINNTNQPALARACIWDLDNNPATANSVIANPAVRMQSFLDRFPAQSHGATACTTDYAGTLAELGQLTNRGLGSPCVAQQPLDVDPAAAGLQPDCIVEDLVGDAAVMIPPCDSDATSTCWNLTPNASVCPAAPQLELEVVRDSVPDPATFTRMRCRIE